MQFFISFCYLFNLCVSINHITKFSDNSYQEFINENNLVVANFYDPKCLYCQVNSLEKLFFNYFLFKAFEKEFIKACHNYSIRAQTSKI